MKKLLAAFAFVGLMACSSEAPAPPASSMEEVPAAAAETPAATLDLEAEAEAEASFRVCTATAPRCCGSVRSDGTCLGNCVRYNQQCP